MIKHQNDLQSQIIFSQMPISEIVEALRLVVREEIRTKLTEELVEKFLSPSEACRLFQPAISKVTLESWSRHGILKKYYFGNRVYYKYSEIIESATSVKKYKSRLLLRDNMTFPNSKQGVH